MATTTEVRAAKARRKTEDRALAKWAVACRELGLPGVSRRSGQRQIRAAKSPGATVNALIREFRYRTTGEPKASVGASTADLGHVQELRARLIVKRGGAGWFPSDPQYLAMCRLEREVAGGLMDLETFEARARVIEAMVMPYPKKLLEAEVLRVGGEPWRAQVLREPEDLYDGAETVPEKMNRYQAWARDNKIAPKAGPSTLPDHMR